MTDDIAGDDARYWAFISYSHRDAAFGRRLHRRLENYALPRRLVGRKTAQGAIPRKLAPIFRDREELPAAHDLSTEVRAALKASRSLIVVCSPSSAASQWVGREIEVFRELHPGRPILAAVRDGEPADCFPKALHGIGPDGAAIEPLAADFRRGRDGEQLGLLKLVAGIIGLGLDELIQRDAHRRNQRVTAVTAAALAGMIVMGVLTGFALSARSEANRQRAEAEGLVGFMSTDLREKLKGVGRLDVMSAVNERALRYYDRELGDLSPQSNAQRALLLQALGEDEENRGDLASALKKFREAYSITAELLAADPKNPERVFDHAQSVFWNGFHDYEQGHVEQAKNAFRDYEHMAKEMMALDPRQPKYERELAFAEGDLCSTAFAPPTYPRAALQLCTEALKHMEAAARRLPHSSLIDGDLSNRHSWLADAYHINGDDNNALSQHLIEEGYLERLMKSDPMNMDTQLHWIALQRNLARREFRSGQLDQSKSRLGRASMLIDEMIAFDPSNKTWRDQQRWLEQDLSKESNPTAKRN